MSYTEKLYNYIEQLYQFYNKELFNSKLPDVIFTISRINKSSGLFSAKKWKNNNGTKIHEISFNPEYINEPYNIELHQTMVHEMCHLWQIEFGTPGRKGYHNKEWADKMISVGLMPSSTGKEGGKTTGQNVSDYIIEDGLFQLCFKKIQKNKMNPHNHLYCKESSADSLIKFSPIPKDEKPRTNTGTRLKYSCSCGNNIWGKKNLDIYCKKCNTDFLVQAKYEY